GTSAISAGGKPWGGLTVWDSEGKELLNLEEENVGFLEVSLSPDGTRVAATALLGDPSRGDRQGAVWVSDLPPRPRPPATEPSSWIPRVTFSPDGTRLATVADGWSGQPSRIVVWDATTGAECARWQGPSGGGSGVVFGPDGRRVAATIFAIDNPGELIVGDLV